MSSRFASIVLTKVVRKFQLRIKTLEDVLEGTFDHVVKVTAWGVNLASTLTFHAVVMDNL